MSIGHPIPELRLFQNLTLKIKGQGDGWGHTSKSQCGSSILSTHTPFAPCQSALPFLRCSIFKIWPWKSRVNVKWPWCCTTTGLDNSIELWMVQMHPGVSEIWVPQSLAQVLPDLTCFFAHGQAIWGKWAYDHDSAQLQAYWIPQNFKRRKSVKRLCYRIWVPQVRQPPARTVTIPVQPRGIRGKKHIFCQCTRNNTQ